MARIDKSQGSIIKIDSDDADRLGLIDNDAVARRYCMRSIIPVDSHVQLVYQSTLNAMKMFRMIIIVLGVSRLWCGVRTTYERLRSD